MSAGGVILMAVIGLAACELEVMYQWPVVKWDMPFNYPLSTPYTGQQTVINSATIGWDKIFFTLPRIWTGNPATLAFTPRAKDGYPMDQSPPLQAYPNWEWHAEAASGRLANGTSNCSGFVSVFRTRIDRCNRLWVMDSGILDSLVTFSVACPPRMFIFDLNTDKLLRTITLPAEVTRPNTLIANFIFDEQDTKYSTSHISCDNMYVYMADTTNPGIIVYDAARDSAWRIQHPYMFPDPDYGTYTVAGESYTLMDGILGLTIGSSANLQRTLYFQAFASSRLFSIPTSVLRAGPSSGDQSELPITLVGHKSSQSASLCTDLRDGSLVFNPVTETAIASWLPGATDHRVLAYDPESLQIVTDIRPAERDNANLWLVSTRLQKFFRRTISQHEINLRVMRLTADQPALLNSTVFFYKK